MKVKGFICLLILILSGCSSVPSVKLKKENFDNLKTVKIEASPNDNSMLMAISTVDVQWTGVSYHYTGIAGDGLGLKEVALKFMDEHEISLNNIVQNQFVNKVKEDNLNISFDNNSSNKLVITLNVVVLSMVHGFSDEFNSRFNIAAQLFDQAGNIIWSYNAIPVSPIAPGYSVKLIELFSSKEAMLKFFNAASEPIVQKLYDNFKKDLV